MTVTAQNTRYPYLANGSTTIFPYLCRILQTVDLAVYLNGVLQSSGYSVSGIGTDAGGNVTFAIAPANGVIVLLQRLMVVDRQTDYQYGGPFNESTVDLDQDRQTMLIQQVAAQASRAIQIPDGESTVTTTPAAASRASKFLVFDALGNVAVSAGTGTDIGLRADLASTSTPANGDGLIGVKQPFAGATARTQHDKNAEISSVLDFGADSTGVIDSAVAFTAAGSALSEIHVPAGIWKLSSSPTAVGTVTWVIHRGASFTGAGVLPGQVVSFSTYAPAWLSSVYNGAWAYMPAASVIGSYVDNGNLCFQSAGRTAGAVPNVAAIGYSSAMINNSATAGSAWNFYGTMVADNAGGGGSATCMELDIVSMSTNTAGTYGLAINAGGELANQLAKPYVFQSVAAGLLIAQNNIGAYANVDFLNGILIAGNAISSTTNTAINMTKPGLAIRWTNATGNNIGNMLSTATTTAQSQSVNISQFGTLIQNSAGQTVFQVNNNNAANAANYFLVSSAAAGQVPQLSAQGSDTNIDIQITPKGSGVLWLGTYTAGAVAQAGYITIKDAGGTTRRLLVG